ncbi:MAG TPA: DUF58 domain-containing protein [Planctomycetota bacterium]|nr:DUF58 domain-containing protein [Planctomycetota bacterium]
MQDYLKYLDPKVLNKITRLDLKARLIVEGYIAGMHKSPYQGVSAEFVTHREYVPGDDLKRLDWKLFGRSDRLYVKQYKQETNLACYILFDVSESMAYGSGVITKLEYSRYIAAALSYLMIQQQDAVGLVLFDSEIREIIAPHSNQAHLNLVLNQLANVTPQKKTDIRNVADYISERLDRRGMVIVISDLLDEPRNILSGLNRLRSKGQDVIVFHILDDFEMRFPFNRLTRFEGMEEYPEITSDPIALKTEYLKVLNEFTESIRRGCQANRIDYNLITTDQKLDVALSAYLARRLWRTSP